jgi:hypothetical protein
MVRSKTKIMIMKTENNNQRNGCIIILVMGIVAILLITISNRSCNRGIETPNTPSTTHSDKYIVNRGATFAATSETSFSTMINCIANKDNQALGTMVLSGQVVILHKNDVVYLIDVKPFKGYSVGRLEGSTEILYVISEHLTNE